MGERRIHTTSQPLLPATAGEMRVTLGFCLRTSVTIAFHLSHQHRYMAHGGGMAHFAAASLAFIATATPVEVCKSGSLKPIMLVNPASSGSAFPKNVESKLNHQPQAPAG